MITCLVKGAYHRGAEVRELSDSLTPGTILTIKRDAENEYDEYACSVYYEDIHIGYIEKEMAFIVSEPFDEEGALFLQAIVQGHIDGGRVKYPEIEIDI